MVPTSPKTVAPFPSLGGSEASTDAGAETTAAELVPDKNDAKPTRRAATRKHGPRRTAPKSPPSALAPDESNSVWRLVESLRVELQSAFDDRLRLMEQTIADAAVTADLKARLIETERRRDEQRLSDELTAASARHSEVENAHASQLAEMAVQNTALESAKDEAARQAKQLLSENEITQAELAAQRAEGQRLADELAAARSHLSQADLVHAAQLATLTAQNAALEKKIDAAAAEATDLRKEANQQTTRADQLFARMAAVSDTAYGHLQRLRAPDLPANGEQALEQLVALLSSRLDALGAEHKAALDGHVVYMKSQTQQHRLLAETGSRLSQAQDELHANGLALSDLRAQVTEAQSKAAGDGRALSEARAQLGMTQEELGVVIAKLAATTDEMTALQRAQEQLLQTVSAADIRCAEALRQLTQAEAERATLAAAALSERLAAPDVHQLNRYAAEVEENRERYQMIVSAMEADFEQALRIAGTTREELTMTDLILQLNGRIAKARNESDAGVMLASVAADLAALRQQIGDWIGAPSQPRALSPEEHEHKQPTGAEREVARLLADRNRMDSEIQRLEIASRELETLRRRLAKSVYMRARAALGRVVRGKRKPSRPGSLNNT